MKRPINVVLATTALFSVMLSSGASALANEQNMHRLVTFIRGAEDVRGFWSFVWSDSERRTALLVQASDGTALKLQQTISLLPVLTITSELQQLPGEVLVRLEERYPTVVAGNLREIFDHMNVGEPVELTLRVRGREALVSNDAIPEDQTDGLARLVRNIASPEELRASVPKDLIGLVQVLAEIAGPERRVSGAADTSYAIGLGLLGSVHELDTKTTNSDSLLGEWRIVERPLRHGPELTEEEEVFLRSIGVRESLE